MTKEATNVSKAELLWIILDMNWLMRKVTQ